MATKKRSALKRIRQAVRRAEIKTLARSSARTAVRRARTAIAGGDDSTASVSAAASALDKAAKRGAIHRNSAARRRSRLAKAAGKATREAAG
ncbi:MAG: 30S ribosomal protein S20 [Candidatus Limnocylindria bacterium]